MPIGSLDLTIVVVYLLGTIALGVWLGRGAHTTKDYLLGGRDLPWSALLVSIVATETSTVTFLSVPGQVFGGDLPGSPGDLRFLQLPLGFLVGRVVAARWLLPLYFRGELHTAYEALQQRFGGVVRGVASALFLVMRTVADGLRLYLTAVVLERLAGIPLEVAVVVTGVSTLVYTFFGGVRAVVWTDVLQFVVYMAGALIAVATLLHALSGTPWPADAADHLRVFDFTFDPANGRTFWTGLVGGACLSLGTHGVDQLIVQRYLCARSQRDAQKALVLSGGVVLLQFALFLGIGFLLWCFYQQHAPAQPFGNGDDVFVDYLVHHMPTGVRGLVLGAVFAAAMSTLSGSLNSSAAALVHDILLPWRRRAADDASGLRLARGATLLFGGLQIAVAVTWSGARSVVDQVFDIAAFTTGTLLGVFLLARLPGAVAPRAALAGVVGGVATTAALWLGLPWLGDGWRVAGLWLGPIAALATVSVGSAVHRFGRLRA